MMMNKEIMMGMIDLTNQCHMIFPVFGDKFRESFWGRYRGFARTTFRLLYSSYLSKILVPEITVMNKKGEERIAVMNKNEKEESAEINETKELLA